MLTGPPPKFHGTRDILAPHPGVAHWCTILVRHGTGKVPAWVRLLTTRASTASQIWTSSTQYAVRNAIRVISHGDRDLYIGADQTGRLVEVVVLDDDGEPVAIHAMALRYEFYEHL